jgi:outer membrane immunogenic protein
MTRKSLLLAVAMVLPAHPALAQAPGDWTGLYTGMDLGGAWGRSVTRDLDAYDGVIGDHWPHATAGFVGGVHLGYNVQSDVIVFGVEGDLGFLGFDGSAPTDVATFNHDAVASTRGGVYGTARGRAGVNVKHWLLYGTGGFIDVDMRNAVVDSCATAPCSVATITARRSGMRPGWTVGGGLEFPFVGNATLRGEFLYFDLGEETLRGTFGSTSYRWPTSTTGQMIRAAISWRFMGP